MPVWVRKAVHGAAKAVLDLNLGTNYLFLQLVPRDTTQVRMRFGVSPKVDPMMTHFVDLVPFQKRQPRNLCCLSGPPIHFPAVFRDQEYSG
jgi:hypothetical protein